MTEAPEPRLGPSDEARLLAAVDLAQRVGATSVEFGHTGDDADVPLDSVTWWAHAQWRGRRQVVEGQASPWEAAEALALALIEGGRCRRCGRSITARPAKLLGRCLWRRNAATWVRGCDGGAGQIAPPNRAARRRARR